jgi:hypothetical protein
MPGWPDKNLLCYGDNLPIRLVHLHRDFPAISQKTLQELSGAA